MSTPQKSLIDKRFFAFELSARHFRNVQIASPTDRFAGLFHFSSCVKGGCLCVKGGCSCVKGQFVRQRGLYFLILVIFGNWDIDHAKRYKLFESLTHVLVVLKHKIDEFRSVDAADNWSVLQILLRILSVI